MSDSPLFAAFAGWLVKPDWADRVIAGAYDSKTPAQRRSEVDDNPFSYLGVTRSRADIHAGEDPTDEDLLKQGAATLSRILEAGAFAPTGRDAFYAYRLTGSDHSQIGVVAALDVEGFFDGRILTHENVRPERAQLLGHHLEVVGATSSPVALTHRSNPDLQLLLHSAAKLPPEVDHTIEGVRHEVWTLSPEDTKAVGRMLSDEVVYVTDGHHRSAAAVAGRDTHVGVAAFTRTLAVLFPNTELRIEAFHRRSPGSDIHDTASLIEAFSATGTIVPVADAVSADPTSRGEIGVYVDGHWFKLTLRTTDFSSALASLDVERLRRHVIGDVLGIDELSEKSGVDYVPAPTGIAELERRCDLDNSVGFLVYPTEITDLMAVAEAGDLMPPKSSYFSPKPRSGIFLRVFGCGATAHLPPS